jgi:hypothetical protein
LRRADEVSPIVIDGSSGRLQRREAKKLKTGLATEVTEEHREKNGDWTKRLILKEAVISPEFLCVAL